MEDKPKQLEQNLLSPQAKSEVVQIDLTPVQNDPSKSSGQSSGVKVAEEQQPIQEEAPEESHIVNAIEGIFQAISSKFGTRTGAFLILFFVCSVGALLSLSKVFAANITNIELIFMVFLVIFLFNYYLVRASGIQPYIDQEDLNFKAKIAGFAVLLTLVSFIYSMQILEKNTAIFIFTTTWAFSVLRDKFIAKRELVQMELVMGAASSVGVFMLLSPQFVSLEGHEGHFFKGFASAVVAAASLSLVTQQFRELRNYHPITINHIQCLISVLFIPVFFPIEGLASPTFLQWLVMLAFGSVSQFLVLIFIKAAFSEEKTSTRILVLLPLVLVVSKVLDFVLQGSALPTSGNEIVGMLAFLGVCYLVFIGEQDIYKAGGTTEQKENEAIVKALHQRTPKKQDIEMRSVKKSTKKSTKK